MPLGDGTGPAGSGPGFFGGTRRGFGGYGGRCLRFFRQGLGSWSEKEEAEALKNEAEYLESDLKNIQARVKELNSSKK